MRNRRRPDGDTRDGFPSDRFLWITAVGAACVVIFLVAVVAIRIGGGARPTLAAFLEIGAGLLLIVVNVSELRRRGARRRDSSDN
jgi:hypothetical protein